MRATALERAPISARRVLVARRLDVPRLVFSLRSPRFTARLPSESPKDQPRGLQSLRMPPEYGYPGTNLWILSLHGMPIQSSSQFSFQHS